MNNECEAEGCTVPKNQQAERMFNFVTITLIPWAKFSLVETPHRPWSTSDRRAAIASGFVSRRIPSILRLVCSTPRNQRCFWSTAILLSLQQALVNGNTHPISKLPQTGRAHFERLVGTESLPRVVDQAEDLLQRWISAQ
jgi:hypothetical protein